MFECTGELCNFRLAARSTSPDREYTYPTAAITLEAWVSPVGAGSRTILAKDKQYFLRLTPENRLAFRVWIGEPSIVGELWEDLDSKNYLVPNAPDGPAAPNAPWRHVAGTYRVFPDGHEEMRLYIDGQEVNSRSTLPQEGLSWTKGLAVPAAPNPFYVGARADYWDNFDGGIDEAAVYANRALSQTELGRHVSIGRDIPDTTITSAPPTVQQPSPTISSLSSATFVSPPRSLRPALSVA